MSEERTRYCVTFTRSWTDMSACLSMVTMWLHASSACAPKSDGTLPSASRPGVPAVMSQRAFAGASTASL